jgi:hypothetical protein
LAGGVEARRRHKLGPYSEAVQSLFGAHAKQITLSGDILVPIDEEWKAGKSSFWTPTP